MPRTKEIPLPALPKGSESSLRIVDIFHDDGKITRLWKKDDGIQVLGLTVDGLVITVTEHGYTHLVGGYVEPKENPENAARRELFEETGYNSTSLKLLTAVYQDSGGSDRAIWFYLATGCYKTQDDEKGIRVNLMPLDKFWQLIIANIEIKPGNKRKGLMSFALATLAFHQLGYLTFTPPNKNESK